MALGRWYRDHIKREALIHSNQHVEALLGSLLAPTNRLSSGGPPQFVLRPLGHWPRGHASHSPKGRSKARGNTWSAADILLTSTVWEAKGPSRISPEMASDLRFCICSGGRI
jgi:hypothetical protein